MELALNTASSTAPNADVPSANLALWRQLEAFRFDRTPDPDLSFQQRLAEENGWTEQQAAQAIEEYRRFLYLAEVAGHPVTPSDQVDQVWHLHLLYTRSYWQDLCGEVLGHVLHHSPTLGGQAEREKFADWYQQTLDSYALHFGRPAPDALWPPVTMRFSPFQRFRRIDVQRFWIVSVRWQLWVLRLLFISGIVGLCLLIPDGSPFFIIVGIGWYFSLMNHRCPRCHRLSALDRVPLKAPGGTITGVELRCHHCGFTQLRSRTDKKNLQALDGGGCGADAGCGGGACGGCAGGCGG
ncbi:MAG: hypothetical protein R3E95_01025 [Thiolinea sp.]